MHWNRFIALGALLVVSASAAETLRVMTFNVRYPAKSDGPDVWELRRDLLVDTIRRNKPDIFGTQELFQFQGQYIVENLSDYVWFGRSRRGNQEDEHMGVFYREDRLKLIESGDYWLSETPEEPGSMSWNVSLPRMVTWGLFEDTTTARRFYFFNTHFAHRREDNEARVQSARVIAERLRKLPQDATIILTGDFNTDAGSEPYKALTGVLQDAWASVQKPQGPTGTFHGFKGQPGKARIDWILYRGAVSPVSVETVTHNVDGRYPSDHFPVLAALEWK
jgi:endonuclease/exonuclease/phosphatase family metal-dependent hydrolase